jgi:hypothetical protein
MALPAVAVWPLQSVCPLTTLPGAQTSRARAKIIPPGRLAPIRLFTIGWSSATTWA